MPYSLFFPLVRGSAEEFGKEGVWRKRSRLKFGVELCPKHKWVRRARELGNFHQHTVGRRAREHKTGCLKRLHIVWIDFVAVAMAFFYQFFLIRRARKCAL